MGLTSKPLGRPVVGITPSLDPGRRIRPGFEYLYMKRAYCSSISVAGGVPVVLTPDVSPDLALEVCDALLITGGEDLPVSVGAEYPVGDRAEYKVRYDWERTLLNAFSAANKSIMGVCYGLQLINIHFGGTLLDDLPSSGSDLLEHGRSDRIARHSIITEPNSRLRTWIGRTAEVASAHHQAVAVLAPGFAVAARAEDGIIEAFESARVVAINWHAESDSTGRGVYGGFVGLLKNGN